MKIYTLHFSIKHVTPDQVRETVQKFIPNGIENLFHGFMSRKVVERKGFDAQWVDLFDEITANKFSFFCPNFGTTQRELMADACKAANATAGFIGPLVDGVKEEWNLWSEKELQGIHYDPIAKTQTLL